MRYTRLRRAIEGGTLIGTHGTPFQGGAGKVVEAGKERKKLLHSTQTEKIDDVEPLVTRRGSHIMRKEKVENGSGDLYDTLMPTDDEKASSLRRKARARKRDMDVDEERPDLSATLLRLGGRSRDRSIHKLSTSPKVEGRHDLGYKNNLIAERKHNPTNGKVSTQVPRIMK